MKGYTGRYILWKNQLKVNQLEKISRETRQRLKFSINWILTFGWWKIFQKKHMNL